MTAYADMWPASASEWQVISKQEFPLISERTEGLYEANWLNASCMQQGADKEKKMCQGQLHAQARTWHVSKLFQAGAAWNVPTRWAYSRKGSNVGVRLSLLYENCACFRQTFFVDLAPLQQIIVFFNHTQCWPNKNGRGKEIGLLWQV